MRHERKTGGGKAERATRVITSSLLALSLAALPLAAIADDEQPAADTAGESAASAAAESQSASSAAASPTPVLHGLYAAQSEIKFSNELTVSTAVNDACGLFAENGGTIIANALTVLTQGDRAAAIATSTSGGNVSLANSKLSTNGADAPLLRSSGRIEVDNVTGEAKQSRLAHIEGYGAILIEGSTLSSTSTDPKTSKIPSSCVSLTGTAARDATTSTKETALFQTADSFLESAITAGSFFYVTNTTANITLSNTYLDFAEDKAKLAIIAGNAGDWGASGKNGAKVTFTGINQKLAGDIEVDSVSSMDLFLLNGSKWRGASGIVKNSAGADSTDNITVHIDSTSGWTVSENSTVSHLSIEKGGSLVDDNGKAVTIVDADGNKLVDGASSVKVTVTDAFDTTVKTTDANKLQASGVDRSAFDAEFGTSTAFGTNGDDQELAKLDRAHALAEIIDKWFKNL